MIILDCLVGDFFYGFDPMVNHDFSPPFGINN